MYFTIFQNMGFRKYEFTHNFSGDVQVPVCSLAQSLQWTFCSLAALCSSASVPGTVQLSAALQHSATGPSMEISKHPAVCRPGHLTLALTLDTHIHEPLSHHITITSPMSRSRVFQGLWAGF